MANFVRHHNDPDLYYDLDRVFNIDLSIPLKIIYSVDYPFNGPSLTETFVDTAERKTRLENILTWSATTGDQFPA